MTPQEWTQLMRDGHHTAQDQAVVRETRAVLDAQRQGIEFPAIALVELLWPKRFAVGEQIVLRAKIFKRLQRLAKGELAQYATRGGKGKFGAPLWLWHRPKPASEDGGHTRICPNCGCEIL